MNPLGSLLMASPIIWWRLVKEKKEENKKDRERKKVKHEGRMIDIEGERENRGSGERVKKKERTEIREKEGKKGE